ncbi:uncharacterized protein LOC119350341 [Triticum dicoccoides]|uniref:uncharacterized protein LOC119350341 n=1 Tax=Triticum dicoccoides TaxID=85692 RepID=UPI00188EAA7A|nr:uncharacterized protein LOC119350341 [Triticum dicoccoides]
MGLITNLHELARHGFRRFLAEDSLMTLQRKCNGMLWCTGPDKEIKSEYLCNGNMLLLKHHKDLVQKILMRQMGFKGAFKDTPKFVQIEHGAWRKGEFIIKEEDITQYLKLLEERRPWVKTDLDADAHTGQSSSQMDGGQSSCKSLDMETNLILKVLKEQLPWPQTNLEADAHTAQSSCQMDAGQSSCQSEDMETNLDAEHSVKNDKVQIYLDSKLATQMMLNDLNELSMDNSKLLPLPGPQPAQEPSSSTAAEGHLLYEKVVEITKVQIKSFHEGCLGQRLVRQLLKDFMWLLGPEVYSSATAGVFLDKTMLQEAISNLLNGEGMQDIVKIMIPKTFPKEILNVLMAECAGKCPEWLLTHKENLGEEKYKQCESQMELIMNLDVVYEETPENFSKILEVMYRIGRCGFPPSDIISGISPNLVEQL